MRRPDGGSNCVRKGRVVGAEVGEVRKDRSSSDLHAMNVAQLLVLNTMEVRAKWLVLHLGVF